MDNTIVEFASALVIGLICPTIGVVIAVIVVGTIAYKDYKLSQPTEKPETIKRRKLGYKD